MNLFWAAWTWRLGDARSSSTSRRTTASRTYSSSSELIEAAKYRPVIDRSYPLEDVVEATKYVETEQKTGNVVLTVT